MVQIGVKEAAFVCARCERCIYENVTGPVCPECAEMEAGHEQWGAYVKGLAFIEEISACLPPNPALDLAARENLRVRCGLEPVRTRWSLPLD